MKWKDTGKGFVHREAKLHPVYREGHDAWFYLDGNKLDLLFYSKTNGHIQEITIPTVTILAALKRRGLIK